MELSYLTACARAIQDDVTKKFSLIDLFQDITIPQGVGELPQFFAVAGRVLDVPEGEVTVNVRVVHEDGTQISNVELRGPVKGGDLDIVARFNLVTLAKAGKYYLKVNFNELPLEDGERYYFTVNKQP